VTPATAIIAGGELGSCSSSAAVFPVRVQVNHLGGRTHNAAQECGFVSQPLQHATGANDAGKTKHSLTAAHSRKHWGTERVGRGVVRWWWMQGPFWEVVFFHRRRAAKNSRHAAGWGYRIASS